MKKSPLKITPVKGRPMLHWVGKKPLEAVHYFPAQLCETVSVDHAPVEPSWEEFIDNDYNLLFHGDNREILSSLLVAGFRGKIDLIYIDPPFDSKADYVRQVKLRKLNKNLTGEQHTVIEQAQYEDIWASDNYLQFMYERLILLRELLSGEGSIYVHCDWHKSHHLRFLLDEVFGAENYINECIWLYKTGGMPEKLGYGRKHDTIHFVARNRETAIWNQQEEKSYLSHKYGFSNIELFNDERGTYSLINLRDVWDIAALRGNQPEKVDYPTQKPEALLERIIKASSHEGSIVLDCFCGSGTTAAVAEKLGRRWIMADLNKGAIQTTIKRLQGVVNGKNGDLAGKNGRGLIHYRVNNYDFARQDELKKIIISKYGIQKNNGDLFFDGTYQGQLVRIIDLNRPLTRLDIQIINDEIADNRPDDERNITVFCNGSELELIAELARQKSPINKITICDIQQDGMIASQPAQALVKITKKGKRATVRIADYISPTILARLNLDRTIFDERIDDFRAQIDYVLIDTDYDGTSFNIRESDLPNGKADFIKGKYDLTLPRVGATVAVKVVDMLGEETLHSN